MKPTTTPMNLHPYLTPDLLTLIRTASPEEIYKRLRYVYAEVDTDAERKRLGFRVEARKSGGRRLGLNLPVRYEGFSFSGGYRSLHRRVNINATGDWRELFIVRFNEVLQDCEKRFDYDKASAKANQERERNVRERKAAVLPLIGELPLHISWYCENRQVIAEKMIVDTGKFTPEQIKQVVDLIRSFQA